MHVRVAVTRRRGKVYRNVQIVRSVRGADGKPTHEVVGSLGNVDDLTVGNLKAAFDASREGAPLLFDVPRVDVSVLANLDYLALAVLLRLWNRSGLAAVLRGAIPQLAEDVDPALIICALVLHRCVAPGSKRSAERWYPGTSLPLLLDVTASTFNNSRIHRALQRLDAAEPDVQEGVLRCAQSRTAHFGALFADLTDTWFVGRGPDLAKKGRDKEGLYRRRIGIMLLCDERGLPLRWKTLPGSYHDVTSLKQLASELAGVAWTRDVPFVVDRAMGQVRSIDLLNDTGLWFVTAIPSDDHQRYLGDGTNDPFESLITQDDAAAAAIEAGFVRIRPDRLVMDVGVVERPRELEPSEAGSRCVEALQDALRVEHLALATARAQSGLPATSVRRRRLLLGLSAVLRARVLAGEFDAVPVGKLAEIAARPPVDQEAAFDHACRDSRGRPRLASRSWREQKTAVRLVKLFSPARFAEARRIAAEQRAEIAARVDLGNGSLARGTRTFAAVSREISDLIRRYSFGDVFAIEPDPEAAGRMKLLVREDRWQARRKSDGLTLIVSHPKLMASARELVELYFSKDAVERDFHDIKSVMELRPVRHRTDPKVRAHVTLCMLALYLERVLAEALGSVGLSARAGIEVLSSCHLNEIATATTFYTRTRLTPLQEDLLRALRMLDLSKDPMAIRDPPN